MFKVCKLIAQSKIGVYLEISQGFVKLVLRKIKRDICREVRTMIGFIGLGNMGICMAKNLMRKGQRVVAFDVDSMRINDIKADFEAINFFFLISFVNR